MLSFIKYLTIKRHIPEVNTLRTNGSKENTEKIDNAIDLYQNTKIQSFRTPRHVVVNAVFPTG